jgi:uncharacterized membrane protein
VIALALSGAAMLWLARTADSGSRAPRAGGTVTAAAFLVVCLVVGGFFRIWALDRSLWRDEFGTLWAIEGPLSDSITRVVGFHGQSPFYYVFVWALVHAFGESEIALRVPSLVFGAAAVVLTAAAARMVAGPAAGLITAGIAWISTGVTGASVNARPYALGLLCCALALYGFLGVLLDGARRYRVAFVLGGGTLVLTHYLYALVLGGLAAGYAIFPSMRTRYGQRAFLTDVAWQAGIAAATVPQFLALWARKGSLVWTRTPDYPAVLRTIIPCAVPALVGWGRPRPPLHRAIEWTLWLSIAVHIGTLALAALAGTNLLIPRYIDVVTIPVAILAGIGASRVGAAAQLVALGYLFLLTFLGALVSYRVTGQFVHVPQEEWRDGVTALERLVAAEPGHVLLQSGFVEQKEGRTDLGSAMLAPLRSPGQTYPPFRVQVLPFAWDSPAAVVAREGIVPELTDPARPTYLLSGGGYTRLFAEWVTTHLHGTVSCRQQQQLVSVEILVCRGSPPIPPVR